MNLAHLLIEGLNRHKDHPAVRFKDRMITYADLMTLLLVFFILLFSISSLNSEKFKYSMKTRHSTIKMSSITSEGVY